MGVPTTTPHPLPCLRLTYVLPQKRPPSFFRGVRAPLRIGLLPTFSPCPVFRWVGHLGGQPRALVAPALRARPARGPALFRFFFPLLSPSAFPPLLPRSFTAHSQLQTPLNTN